MLLSGVGLIGFVVVAVVGLFSFVWGVVLFLCVLFSFFMRQGFSITLNVLELDL